MIIEFPTALYGPVLPKSVSDSTSITYTISSQNPPKRPASGQELPVAEEIKPLPAKLFTKSQNRETFGDLLFVVSQATQSDLESNKKQFEIGQLLDFQQEENIDLLTNLGVPERIDLLQNTNILDLDSLGLTEDEQQEVIGQANIRMDEIIEEINVIKEQISNNKAKIRENQKSLNENRKAQQAIDSIGSTDLSDIIDRLETQEGNLEAERSSLIAETNLFNEQAEQKFAELLRIRELVR